VNNCQVKTSTKNSFHRLHRDHPPTNITEGARPSPSYRSGMAPRKGVQTHRRKHSGEPRCARVKVQNLINTRKKTTYENKRLTDPVLKSHKDKPTDAHKPTHTPVTQLGSQPMTARPKEQQQEERKKQRQIRCTASTLASHGGPGKGGRQKAKWRREVRVQRKLR
jgi:hypothetical protein